VDRKGHAALVDEYRQKRGDKNFIAVSSASSEDGSYSVIVAVSRDLTSRVKAPEIMKELGLRGGGRPEFAQGALGAGEDVEGLRRKARETASRLVSEVPA
jgi:alanyl-tRNA synthetase